MSFTGTRNRLTDSQKAVIVSHLLYLDGATGFVTGACIGIDHFIGESLVQMYPHARHRVIVPANRSRVARWWPPYGALVEVEEMPPGTSYAARNLALVNASAALVGYPLDDERSAARRGGSGSWQTIRMARQVHAPVRPLFFPVGAM